MPPNGAQYDSLPPIPSYDEATHGSSSRGDWAPPRSPFDDRPHSETEAQSLLTSNSRAGDRRHQNGYQPPSVETDDEDSQWSLASDDEDATEDAQVRREMQELEIEDPLNGTSSRAGSRWRKRIAAFSLPQWKWRWRMPRLTVRLPRASDITSTSPGDGDSEPAANPERRWVLPRLQNVDSTTLFILVGRLLAVFLVLGFLYLLFVSDIFANMSRRMGGQQFDPESVRLYVQNSVDSSRIRNSLKHFTNYAHIAGTEGDYALAMDVHNSFLKSGLEEIMVDEYYVYLNYPKAGGRAVEIIAEDGKTVTWKAAIEEREMGGETAGRQTFAFHGHSKTGDVRGPLIYANYGSRDDFKRLQDRGIETKGAIALVRYYGSQGDRALKVKAAELAGFAGCLIYSDPADDGFLQGPEAPGGRFMPSDGVQRGAVSLMSWVVGDVLTPGWASKKGQPRETTTQTKGLVQIPSLPLAWRDAKVLLQSIQNFGEECPDAWRGGVPDVKWWTGNSSSPTVRLLNDQEEVEQQPIWNVYGKIAGIEQGQKSIIIGNHRDAWSFGATDPGSGTAIMLEVARIMGDLKSKGWRPLRTVQFMSWDAEEYNLIGSTEFVENNLDNLRRDAFAYLNLDTAVFGSEFHAAGSPVFRSALLRILDRVMDPQRNQTLRALWEQRNGQLEGLGAGSDYVAFQDIAGTSSIDLSFQGEKFPYHSSYDNYDWMARVGDPDFHYHNLMGQVLVLLALDLADRPVLPFDMNAYTLAMGRYLSDLWKWAQGKGAEGKLKLDKIEEAVKIMETNVPLFERWEMHWEHTVTASGGWEPIGLGNRRVDYNTRMANFETGLLDLEYGGGIPNRTQFVHTVFGPQLWSGYDEAYFPGIRDAVEVGDWALAQKLADKIGGIIAKAAIELTRDWD